jgi:RNA polymerase sigma factor (sigma-70 family)
MAPGTGFSCLREGFPTQIGPVGTRFAADRSLSMGEVDDEPDEPMDVKSDRSFDVLYREQADRLWRAVFAYTGDREVTNDAVAEAFAQSLRRGDALRSPKAWVWRAAFQIARGEMKRRTAASPLIDERGYEMSEPAWELIGALRSLPERQRVVLVLRYYAGYSVREIAEIVGSTAATVRVHLSRGRRRLRDMLEEDDDA